MSPEHPAQPARAPGPDVAAEAEPSPVTAGPPTRLDPSSADARSAAPAGEAAGPLPETGSSAAAPSSAGSAASPRLPPSAPSPPGTAPSPPLPPGVRRYVRDGAAVTYEVALCRHAAECVRGLPQVFDTTKRPWIRPENASVDELEVVISRCPTRALKLERDPAIQGPAATA